MLTLDRVGQGIGLAIVGLLLSAGLDFAHSDAGSRLTPGVCAIESHRPSMALKATNRVAGAPLQAGLVRGLASPDCP